MSLINYEFKRIEKTIGDQTNCEYFIDQKTVDEKTYNQMFDELFDELNGNKKSKYKKIIKNNDLTSNKKNVTSSRCDEDSEENCICEECNDILSLLKQIKNLSEKDAFHLLKYYIDDAIEISYITAQRDTLRDLAFNFVKTANEIEEEIDFDITDYDEYGK